MRKTAWNKSSTHNPKEIPFADGTEYTVWIWKGNYLNLGAGCETGIYYGDKGEYHKDSGSDTNLNMHISLYDKNTGKEIFSYCPEDPQWWVTGFNPKYQDYEADDLAVHGCIDFSKKRSYGKHSMMNMRLRKAGVLMKKMCTNRRTI